MEAYCRLQSSSWISDLPPSTQEFLRRLHLPLIHPFCKGWAKTGKDWLFERNDLGNEFRPDLVTSFHMLVPPLVAFAHLWGRLLAGVVAPIGLMCLFYWQTQTLHKSVEKREENASPLQSFVCQLTVLSSLVIMTDSLYVYEYGMLGAWLFLLSFLVSWRLCEKRLFTKLYLLCLLSMALWTTTDGGTSYIHFGAKEDVQLAVAPGLYYNQKHPLLRRIFTYWSPPKYRSTPWMYTGDARTGLLYFFNNVQEPEWKRVYLPVKEDGEVVALDFCFPPTGFNASEIVYFVLHGVNGGSKEGYVQDLAHRATKANATVAVMVSRGLMDLPLRGPNLFHGARISDAHMAARAVKRALYPNQPLVGVGYSMGGIVLSHYAVSSGSDCALDAAVAISGALDCRMEQHYMRSQRLWQPMIANFMKERLQEKFSSKLISRVGHDHYRRLMRFTNVVDVDEFMSVQYDRFESIESFYAAMSALGDVPLDLLRTNTSTYSLNSTDRRYAIQRLAIPLLVMHALDDPISTWRTIVANQGMMHPEHLVELNGNVVLWLTAYGGHVGWPVGWALGRNWEYISEIAMNFAASFVHARTEVALS